jgi:ribulose-phosphate 3-epimerase
MKKYMIAPSILSANFAKLGEEVLMVMSAGADLIHCDIMDNHYVPNLTFGPLVCDSLRKSGIAAPLDVHLMTKPVDSLIVSFAKAGANWITFHPDATPHVNHSLELIKNLGCFAGLAVNPEVSLEGVIPFLQQIDLLLLMTVKPGFGGQSFMDEQLDKISEARRLIDQSHRSIQLAIDGGVKENNIQKIAAAGADMFVMGSAIFGAKDPAAVIQNVKELLSNSL